jgi:hypothetical protein
MRSDRPLLGSVLCLAGGLGVILGYCQGASTFNAAYPFSGSTLHIDVTTTGPGVLGGLALIAAGLVLMVWAVLAAIVGQIGVLSNGGDREPERLLD